MKTSERKGGLCLDNRAIGVFDSGLGGLTAVQQLQRLLPQEDIIYFGDTGRVPYGTRSREIILKYAKQDMAFLKSMDVKAIVIACGTVSSVALGQLDEDLPVIGVLVPTVRQAIAKTKNGRIGIIATGATIQSGAYQRLLVAENADVYVVPRACPLFVPLVENGRFGRGDLVAEQVVLEYLAPIKAAGVDTLILGCTHYPLLSQMIGDFMGDEVTLINAGKQAANETQRLLTAENLLSEKKRGKTRYFVSDDTKNFIDIGSIFLKQAIPQEDVCQIDISAY